MSPAQNPRRWSILALLGVAQLMVVLDATVVNIALPSAQHALGFSDSDRQWIITAYSLAFGSLLLLGGRIADLFGRKRVFIVGLLGFAGASALGGAAGSFELLVSARAPMSIPTLTAAPPTAEASANPTRPISKAHLRPMTSAMRPPSSSSEPKASA